jgi:hypothetical protein
VTVGPVVVVGGYGNAGRRIVELLLRHTDRPIVVAGRNLARAEAFAGSLADPRVRAARADATDKASLGPLLDRAEALVVAAGTSDTWRMTAEASLMAGCHQFDIQIGSTKNAGLRGLDARAREVGVCIVTDCGFHPGVPAAMVRAVAGDRPGLARAVVSSWIALDWAALGAFSDSTVTEMLQEFADYRYEALVDGRWVAPRRTRPVVFPAPVGRQRVAAMGLDEMRAVAGALPALRETGFYVGGFPGVVNYAVIPLVYAGMKVAPKRAARPLGRLLDVGLRRCSRPPYATFLQLDGGEADQPVRPLMRLRHDDAYLLTAAPVVAAVRQVLADPLPGVHLQGMLVEPTTFFADLATMGVEVWTPSASTEPGRSSPHGDERG